MSNPFGTVESVDGDHIVVSTHPLTVDGGVLALGAATSERMRWRSEGGLADRRAATVSAHWGWVCDALTDDDVLALTAAREESR